MARRDLNVDEEKRSYAGLWALSAGLLMVGAIWALMDDVFLRRPWKEYQRSFYSIEVDRARDALKKEEDRLNADPQYQELTKQLAEAKKDLESGAGAKKIADANRRLVTAQVREHDADLRVRFIKSELEEAWYDYDHAIEENGNVAAVKTRRDELSERKVGLDKDWKEAQEGVEQIEREITEVKGPAKALEDKLKDLSTERERLATKLDGMKSTVLGFDMPRIPTIQQTVLLDYDRTNFDNSLERVDRCQSCHIAIDKAGFDDLPNPLKTHPERETLLGKHPVDKFGCTSCHEGQGPALNSVNQAHGDVEFWDHPLLSGVKAQSRCIGCHRDVSQLAGTDTLKRGEYLFEQLGCHGCHLVQGYDNLDQVGPNLKRAAAKLDPQWIVNWVHNPYEFRPRTKMPNFLLTEEQSTAVAAYIWHQSKDDAASWTAAHPDPGGIAPGDPALVEKGKQLFDSVGCRACHAIGADEVASPLGAIKDVAPNLSRVGEKASPRFIYWWIKNPRDYSPNTRMPNLRLSDDEARAIASYLVSLAQPAKPSIQVTAEKLDDPQLVDEGKSLVRKYGCFGCHAINGMESESRIGVELSSFGAKNLEELYFGNRVDIPHTWDDWTYNKLANPRIYQTEHVEQVMPNFMLADDDIVALRVWLRSRTERNPPEKYRDPDYNTRDVKLQDGRRVVEKYNCIGCHLIEGRGGYIRRLYQDNLTLAPPILTGEGGKVQPDWLFGFLKDPSRTPLRTWLKVRMPTFQMSDAEATAIVEYFAASSRLAEPFVYFDPGTYSTPELIDTGKRLMSKDYFDCFACHVRGSETPAGPPEQWAPNLAYARHRLNPDWILKWIHNPQALMPGTKMPSFYPGGPDDVFGGDEDKQIRAIRDYIMTIGADPGGKEAPKPGVGQMAAERGEGSG